MLEVSIGVGCVDRIDPDIERGPDQAVRVRLNGSDTEGGGTEDDLGSALPMYRARRTAVSASFRSTGPAPVPGLAKTISGWARPAPAGMTLGQGMPAGGPCQTVTEPETGSSTGLSAMIPKSVEWPPTRAATRSSDRRDPDQAGAR